VPSQGEAGSNTELAERVKSILASKHLTLHRASERSATLFGRRSPYYVPHNLYYDLSHGSFSPSLFQLFAFSRISDYRLRDWLQVFGFDIGTIPRLQIQPASRRTALLESSLDDPTSRIPWFQNLRSGAPPADVVPLSQLLDWTQPRRLASLPKPAKNFLYAKIGDEDAMAFPELLPGSIVRVNLGITDKALQRITGEGSADLFLIQHARGVCCCHIRAVGRGRIATISTQLPYAQVQFRVPEEARIVGVADFEIRSLLRPQPPSIAKRLSKRWRPDVLSPEPSQLGPLLRRARLEMGLSFRAAAAMSRQIADALGDGRYFTASGSLSDYEVLNTPPRHFHKIVSFCAIYSLRLNTIFETLGLNLREAGQEPIPDLLTGRPWPADEMAGEMAGEIDEVKQGGFLGQLVAELGEVPFFLRGAIDLLSGLPRLSLKDFFWIGGTHSAVHPYLAGGVLAVVNRQKKKLNGCGSKPLWQQPLYVILKRDGTYLLGCCSRENNSLVVHSYPDGVHKREQFRNRDAEVIGKIAAVARKL
jgi:hypothetical protein